AWRWRLPALAAGALLGGPAFAVGLVVGDLGRRRIGDPGAVGAVLVGVAAVAAGRGASQQTNRSGLPPTWCDVLAALGVGLVASVVLTRAAQRSGRGWHAGAHVVDGGGRGPASVAVGRRGGRPGADRGTAPLASGAPRSRVLHPG